MGPAFLHGNWDTETYTMLFQFLAFQLGSLKQHLVIGGDDKKALRAAISRAFPDAKRMVCMRHLKNNVIDYLKDKVGLDSHRRKDITDKLFGQDGLVDSHIRLTFDLRWSEVLEEAEQLSPIFHRYLTSRLGPILHTRKLGESWCNITIDAMD